jgi:hypothetical protein
MSRHLDMTTYIAHCFVWKAGAGFIQNLDRSDAAAPSKRGLEGRVPRARARRADL